MHEMSLMADLLKKIEQTAREAEATRVTRVRVTLGALSHISADHFREHFLTGTLGSMAEGAKLEVLEDTDTNSPLAQEIVLNSLDVAD